MDFLRHSMEPTMHPAGTGEGKPGPVVLFGSGETSPRGQKIFDYLFSHFLSRSAASEAGTSPRVAVLETPAGFELNSPQVAGRVADFLEHHLQNFAPLVQVVAARKRGTPFSPDSYEVVAPLLYSDLIFLGPGSPSYAIRQLRHSLAWYAMVARHQRGGALVLASAASIAFSSYALPVYEIYKVGQDIHWKEGLGFFETYGLPLVVIPHWNNTDGGEELDTSRCFMGRERFELLLSLLPPGNTVVGIDEKTGLLLDLEAGICQVLGKDGVTVIREGKEETFREGKSFSLQVLGDFRFPEVDAAGVPASLWRAIDEAAEIKPSARPSREVLALVQQRQEARASREWQQADALRQEIARLGWLVQDTTEGPRLEVVRQ
jgi:hypothetical protein